MVRTSVQFPLPAHKTTMMAVDMPVMEDQLHETSVYRLGRERSTYRLALPLPETDDCMTSIREGKGHVSASLHAHPTSGGQAWSAGMSSPRSASADEKRSCGSFARQRCNSSSNACIFGEEPGRW